MLNKLKLLGVLIAITLCSYGQNIDKVVAIIGDHAIFLSELEDQKLQAVQQGLSKDEATAAVLEEMMLEKLLLHQAEIDSIVIPEAQVNQELDQRIQYFASQMPGGVADLEKFYGKSIQEIKDEFYVQIENRMKTEQMQSSISGAVTVSPKEVRTFFNSFPKDSIPLVGSKVQIAQIQLNPIITTDEKLEVKQQLEKIRQDIIDHKISFEAAAKNFSCDKGSAEQYGDFGWVGRGQFVPEFENMAYTTPIDTISPVFESQYGYHILKIDKRRGEQFKGRHILLCMEPSFVQLAVCKKRLDSIRTAISSGSITWEKAVKEFSDDDLTKGSEGIVYNQNSGTSLLDMQELDPITFQKLDPLTVGEMSQPFIFETFDGKSYKMIKLNQRTTPHKANMKDDYQMIQTFALQNKKNEVLEEWASKKMNDVFIKISSEYKTIDYRFDWLSAK